MSNTSLQHYMDTEDRGVKMSDTATFRQWDTRPHLLAWVFRLTLKENSTDPIFSEQQGFHNSNTHADAHTIYPYAGSNMLLLTLFPVI